MAARVCCLCGGGGNTWKRDRMFECVRCHRPEHIHCHSLGKKRKELTPCDTCLDDDKKKGAIAQWVKSLAAIDSSEQCEEMYFFFCATYGYGARRGHFCNRCCPVSDNHKYRRHNDIIKIKYDGERRLVRPEKVNHIFDCSDIQREIPGWVLLRPKPGTPVGSGGEKSCGRSDCHREIIGPYTYCCIKCKRSVLRKELHGDMLWFLRDLLGEFKGQHRRNDFCLDCCAAFNSNFCADHNDSRHTVINIIEIEGCHLARFHSAYQAKCIGPFESCSVL